MNIVFYLLVIMALVVLWFALTFMFKPIGKYLYRVYKDTSDVMIEADTEKEKEN